MSLTPRDCSRQGNIAMPFLGRKLRVLVTKREGSNRGPTTYELTCIHRAFVSLRVSPSMEVEIITFSYSLFLLLLKHLYTAFSGVLDSPSSTDDRAMWCSASTSPWRRYASSMLQLKGLSVENSASIDSSDRSAVSG